MVDTPTIAGSPSDDDESGPSIDQAADESDPSVSDAGGETLEEAVEDANAEQKPDRQNVEEAAVELSEDDFAAGNSDLFSGVEDSESAESGMSDSESGGDSGDEGDESDNPMDGMVGDLDGNAAALEDSINEGAARLAVVGLTEDDFEDSALSKDSLEDEFAETFAAFRLGYFGSQAIDQYVLQPADGDVSPAWGMAGSMLMAAAMVVWMRPDGDEKMSAARDAIEGIVGGEL